MESSRSLAAEGLDFDLYYTSYLKQVIHTPNIVLDEIDRAWLPAVIEMKLDRLALRDLWNAKRK